MLVILKQDSFESKQPYLQIKEYFLEKAHDEGNLNKRKTCNANFLLAVLECNICSLGSISPMDTLLGR